MFPRMLLMDGISPTRYMYLLLQPAQLNQRSLSYMYNCACLDTKAVLSKIDSWTGSEGGTWYSRKMKQNLKNQNVSTWGPFHPVKVHHQNFILQMGQANYYTGDTAEENCMKDQRLTNAVGIPASTLSWNEPSKDFFTGKNNETSHENSMAMKMMCSGSIQIHECTCRSVLTEADCICAETPFKMTCLKIDPCFSYRMFFLGLKVEENCKVGFQ